MKLLKKILDKCNGLHYPQEYLCLATETFEQPLRAFIVIDGRPVAEITNHHSFVGYSPVIFALLSSKISSSCPGKIDIAFSAKALSLNEDFTRKDAVAALSFKKIKQQQAGKETILYYEGLYGRHGFVTALHQFIAGLNNRLYQKKPGNVFLPGNLYKQVQVAYSLPRNISLITVGQNNHFNLFPTDLHGAVDENYYIISLRHEGKACRQVTNSDNILLTQIHSDYYKTAYSLGKNHMQEMKEKETFPFSSNTSAYLQLPVPESALFYRELELQDSFIHGIHRLMLFKTLHQQRLQRTPSTLAHIHAAYATWRQNNQLPGNYLLR